MGDIQLRAEDARSAASDMTKAANEAEAQFNNTRSRLTDLENSFKGQTATNFEAKFVEWRKNATDLIDSLNGLAKFLSTAANTIEQTDADIAKQLNT